MTTAKQRERKKTLTSEDGLSRQKTAFEKRKETFEKNAKKSKK